MASKIVVDEDGYCVCCLLPAYSCGKEIEDRMRKEDPDQYRNLQPVDLETVR